MEILSEEDLAARLDFCRPLHPEPEPKESVWCIPFEFGPGEKGTRISIAKAKEIAAELRASVAEAEKRQLRRAFDDERKRNETLSAQFHAEADAKFALMQEVAMLKKKLRARRLDKRRR